MSNPPTFERDRINYLKNERILSQKKTFTKWINSFLNKVCNKLLLISMYVDFYC
jgi:spectrin beta